MRMNAASKEWNDCFIVVDPDDVTARSPLRKCTRGHVLVYLDHNLQGAVVAFDTDEGWIDQWVDYDENESGPRRVQRRHGTVSVMFATW